MKKLIILLAIAVLAVTTNGGAHETEDFKLHFHHSHDYFDGDNRDFDFRDGSVIITYDDENVVEIDEHYRLYINHDRIKTDIEQDELLEKYHKTAVILIEQAKDIGMEGKAIGIRGAKIGIKAIAKVIKLLSPYYDAEDLETEMEAETRGIEKQAEKLEKIAEKIEKNAEKLEKTYSRLVDITPELEDVVWRN